MARPKGESAATRLSAWIAEHQPGEIDVAEMEHIRADLAPVSESHLRKLLRSSGARLAPVVEGVVQDNFDELARTLGNLEAVYTCSDREQARRARECVLTAKQHALWALKRTAGGEPERVAAKREVLLWLQTWLENPALFSAWVKLRRRQTVCLPPRVEES